MRDDRRTLGRYDGRFEGIDSDAAGETPESDAADTAIRGAFTGAFNDYLERDLNYSSDVDYKVSATAIRDWDWKHAIRGSAASPAPVPIMGSDLGDAMRANPHLKVMSANGYFDLATPFFATEYDLGHMDIDTKLRSNLSFTYYPSGHMVYSECRCAEAVQTGFGGVFYDSAAPRSSDKSQAPKNSGRSWGRAAARCCRSAGGQRGGQPREGTRRIVKGCQKIQSVYTAHECGEPQFKRTVAVVRRALVECPAPTFANAADHAQVPARVRCRCADRSAMPPNGGRTSLRCSIDNARERLHRCVKRRHRRIAWRRVTDFR